MITHHKVACLALCLGLTACATSPEQNDVSLESSDAQSLSHPNDPFEPLNRWMWTINYEYLDPYLLRPAALGYVEYVPSPVRMGVRNFLSNLEEPASMVNSLVMWQPEKALTHFNRFWINSIFGIVGLIDVAGEADIKTAGTKGLGDVMGYYGVGHGPYFMVPLYGPVTLREGTGDIVDGLYFPLNLLSLPQSLAKMALEGLEDRATLVSQEALLESSLDPYTFTRDAYLQYRNFRASGGKAQEESTLPDEDVDNYLDEVDQF